MNAHEIAAAFHERFGHNIWLASISDGEVWGNCQCTCVSPQKREGSDCCWTSFSDWLRGGRPGPDPNNTMHPVPEIEIAYANRLRALWDGEEGEPLPIKYHHRHAE